MFFKKYGLVSASWQFKQTAENPNNHIHFYSTMLHKVQNIKNFQNVTPFYYLSFIYISQLLKVKIIIFILLSSIMWDSQHNSMSVLVKITTIPENKIFLNNLIHNFHTIKPSHIHTNPHQSTPMVKIGSVGRQKMRVLKQLDSQPYSIQLNYKNKFDFKSYTGGCISLIFYLAAIGILSFNLYQFITQDHFIFNQEEIKNDLGTIYLNPGWFGLLLTATDDKGQGFNITHDIQLQYGIKVFVEHVNNINGSDFNPTIEAVPGKNNQHFNFTNFFMFPDDFNMKMSGRSDVIMENIPYNRLGMIVKNISQPGTQYKQFQTLQVKLIFVNNVTSPKYENPIIGTKTRICYIRDGIPLAMTQLQQLTLYFKKLNSITDTNKFITSNSVFNSTFYDEELFTSVVSHNQDTNNSLVQIKFKRSLYTLRYNRSYKKMAAYLGESFGVIGLISLIFIVYRGYNKWCFTENQLIPKKHRQNTNIFRYYKHRLMSLKKMTESGSAIEEFQHRVDIKKILETLDNYESRLRLMQGKSSLKYDSDHQPQHAVPIMQQLSPKTKDKEIPKFAKNSSNSSKKSAGQFNISSSGNSKQQSLLSKNV